MSKTKIEFMVDEEALKILHILQYDTNASCLAEVLRNAIGLYEWSRKQALQGSKIVSIDSNNRYREVVLPFHRKKK